MEKAKIGRRKVGKGDETAKNTSKLLTQLIRMGHVRITFCQQWLVFSRDNNFPSFLIFKSFFHLSTSLRKHNFKKNQTEEEKKNIQKIISNLCPLLRSWGCVKIAPNWSKPTQKSFLVTVDGRADLKFYSFSSVWIGIDLRNCVFDWLMGFLVDTQKEGGGHSWGYVRSLVRRKQVDSANGQSQGHQLAKALTVPHLVAIGILISWVFMFCDSGFLINTPKFDSFEKKFGFLFVKSI